MDGLSPRLSWRTSAKSEEPSPPKSPSANEDQTDVACALSEREENTRHETSQVILGSESNFRRTSQHEAAATLNMDEDVYRKASTRLSFKISHHVAFRATVNIIILINALQMGAAADHRGAGWDDVWSACDHFFTAIFAMEMVLMLAALRRAYFLDPWNFLDFAIATIAIIDTWILKVVMNDQSGDLYIFRVFRLLRLLRMLKVVHVVPELMTVVEGLVASLKSMMWIFMLLVLVIYSAGICCVEVIGHSKDFYPASSDVQEVMNDEVVNSFNAYLYFGTVLRSMVSLLNVVLMADWSGVVRPVFERQKTMIIFFVCVAILCTFGLLNVIIGVVVERTTEAMNGVKRVHLEKEKQEQMQMAVSLAEVMFAMDTDNNDRLSRAEMEKAGQAPELLQILRGIDLPYEFTFSELLMMLDTNGDGSATKAEFVRGMMRLIHSSVFQRNCMLQVGQGLIAEKMRFSTEDLSKHVFDTLDNLRTEIRKEFQTLRDMPLRDMNWPQPKDLKANDLPMPARESQGSSSAEKRLAEGTPPSVPSSSGALRAAEDIQRELELYSNSVMAESLKQSASSADAGAVFEQYIVLPIEESGMKGPADRPDRSNQQLRKGSVDAKSAWESLPVRLLTCHAQLEADFFGSLAGSAVSSSGQQILGFLPVVGPPSAKIGARSNDATGRQFPL